MKGTFRSARTKGSMHRTDFDDWSDPLLKTYKHKNAVRHNLTSIEKKERLNKFKNKTGYSQTVNDVENIRLMVQQGEPLLPQKKIRQLRLPFYNGLLLNLKDDGYPSTSEYIKELIVLDDMFAKHDPSRVLIRSDKTVLDKLAEGLKLAEDAEKTGNKTAEAQAFMDLALYFTNSESPFHWLAEELLEQCVELLNDSNSLVDPKVEATVRFVYSSYLLDFQHDLEKSKHQLQLSMKLSVGKNFWLINDDGERGDVLFLKSCVVLSKIDLEEAHGKKNVDIEQAIQSCRSSLYWAKQANDKPATATSLLTLAEFYLSAKIVGPVLDILHQHIRLCKSASFYRELCEGYVLLSKYHESVGNDAEVVQVIEELISFALDKGLMDIVTKAHLKLAEICSTRRVEKMKYHATTGFNYCKLVGSNEELELASCLVGIGQSHQIFNTYASLILHSENLESDELTKLLNWKMFRMPFFSEDKKMLFQAETEKSLTVKSELEEQKANEETTRRRETIHSRELQTYKKSRHVSVIPSFLSGINSILAKRSVDFQTLSSGPSNASPMSRTTIQFSI